LEATHVAIDALRTGGLLLLQDKTLKSVVTIVIGETLAGSWWAHPRGHEVFRCVNDIADHADVLVCKLFDGKVTFVHRWLWPPLLAVATAGEPWQTAGLSREGRALLERVVRERSVVSSGEDSKEIERRLLVHGEQVHTESGMHQNRLETWQAWASRAGCEPDRPPAEGRAALEAAVRGMGGSVQSLPWHRYGSAPGRRRAGGKRKESGS
jgi:hypothetical protein